MVYSYTPNLNKKWIVLSFVLMLVTVSNAQQGGQIQGVTTSGIKGISKAIGEIIAYEKVHPVPADFKAALRPELKGPIPVGQNPEAQSVSKSGSLVTAPATSSLISAPIQSVYSNFLTIWGSYANVAGRESPYVPPDNCGDVGTTQVVATANTRMKVFDKPGVTGTPATTPTGSATTTLTATLDIDLNVFFTNSVLGINNISDPHVRFDRLSKRWFIVAIDVNHKTNNYCCVAVSNSDILSSQSSFTIFYFNVSQTGGSANDFFDYPTLGVDNNALYIGGNMFARQVKFSGSNMWVVNKASLVAASPSLTVTCFPHSLTNTDMYSPQGVHNDDPGAVNGYFVGASQTAYSKLNLRRISYSNGSPVISGDIPLTTITTYTPKTVPTLGGTNIDGGDRRPFAAMIKKNKITGTADLWVAQCTLLNISGVGGSTGDRDGALWLEIGNLATTPAILQQATLYDNVNGTSAAVYYTYPTIALSGQGHNIMGFTSAGPQKYAQAGVAGRFRTDSAGTFRLPIDFTTSTSTYNPGSNRWGDFTQTVVDPLDDMTMWTFSEYTSTTDSWGVRAAQLKAPPPAAPSLASTPSCGTSTVTINGTSTNNSEFYDPGNDAGGPGFKRLVVSVDGGVTVSNTTYVSPTKLTAIFTLPSGAPAGTYNVTVTNPDGQLATTSFTLASACPTTLGAITNAVTARVAVEEDNKVVVKAYPNPVNSIVNVELVSPREQKANLELFDMAGKTIHAQELGLIRGVNRHTITVSDFATGSYIIQVKDLQGRVLGTAKIIKN